MRDPQALAIAFVCGTVAVALLVMVLKQLPHRAAVARRLVWGNIRPVSQATQDSILSDWKAGKAEQPRYTLTHRAF